MMALWNRHNVVFEYLGFWVFGYLGTEYLVYFGFQWGTGGLVLVTRMAVMAVMAIMAVVEWVDTVGTHSLSLSSCIE